MNVPAPDESFVDGVLPTSEASILAMIERFVLDSSISLDRLEHLLLFRERMEDRAREEGERVAKKAYFSAMSRCQAELPVVTRTKLNKNTHSTYADLAAIEEQAMPVIYRHGFAVSFQPDGYNGRGELRIFWQISHNEGHSRDGIAEVPVDGAVDPQGKVNKTGTQAFGSTATYGRRYLLCMLFNISTGDDRDGNVEQREAVSITPAQAKTIERLLEETSSSPDQFCRMRKIAALSDLPASDYERAVRLLYQRRAKLRSRKDR